MERRKWSQVGIGVFVCIVIVALAGVAATGCSSANASGGPLGLTQADNGKAYAVKVGDIIQVVIAGNPTTGFAWAAELTAQDAAVLEQVGEPAYEENATDQDIVGAGGTYTFTFKALAEGQATLRLVYERAWEDVEPEQTFEVQVTVE